MKILINESQLEGVIKNYLNKFYKDKIKDIEIDGSNITIIAKGEKNYFTLTELKNNIKDDLKNVFSGKNFKLDIKFEKEFEAEIDFYGDEESGYSVSLTKTLDNGDIFELEGELRTYHSGRATEYEVEPTYISDDDYFSENWEIIEEYILDKWSDFQYKQIKK